jgi:hypothetical protein
MAYRYSDSEKFRANLHLIIGSTLCTPLCLLIMDLIRDNKFIGIPNLIASLIFFVSGSLLINNSYHIMNKKDEQKND